MLNFILKSGMTRKSICKFCFYNKDCKAKNEEECDLYLIEQSYRNYERMKAFTKFYK